MKHSYVFKVIIVSEQYVDPRLRASVESKARELIKKFQEIVARGSGWISTLHLQDLGFVMDHKDLVDPATWSKLMHLWSRIKELVAEGRVVVVRQVYVYPDKAVPMPDQEVARILRKVGLSIPTSRVIVSEAHMGLKTRELYHRWEQERKEKKPFKAPEGERPHREVSTTPIRIEREERKPSGLGLLLLLALAMGGRQ